MMKLEVASDGISWAHVRASRILSRFGKAGLALTIASVYGMGDLMRTNPHGGGQTFLGVLGGAYLLGIFSLLLSYIVFFARGSKPGVVSLDATSLTVARGGGVRVVPREAVASALVVHRPRGAGVVWTVEIDLRDGDRIAVATAGEVEARALVAALGYGPGEKRVHVELAAPSRRLLHVALGLAAYYVGGILAVPFMFVRAFHGLEAAAWLQGIIVAAGMLAAHALFKRLARPAAITIGEDGVVWTSGRKRRFVPRAEILRVDQASPAVPLVLQTREGPVTFGGSSMDLARRAAAGRILYERLVAPAAGTERVPLFERGGRSVAEWRENLRRMLDDATYRSASASGDDAAAILKSPVATAEQRVGAALALRVAGAPPERIRVAAEGIADERVRVALEAVAVEDDVRVEEALAKVGRRR